MMQIKTGTFNLNSPTISGLDRTSDLVSGLYLYSSSLIPVNTTILALPAGDASITMSRNSLASASTPGSFEVTTAAPGVWVDRTEALIDTKATIDERGDLVEIFLRKEGDVVRDRYNSIEKRNQSLGDSTGHLFFKTYPVQFSPSEKQLEKAGIKEKTDVIIYTAFYDWLNAGKNFKDIDITGRLSVNLQGETYELRNKGLVSQMNDVFLYITLGLAH